MSTQAVGRLSRRQRLREATTEEVLAVADALLARDGGAGLTLRAIAREMGLTPSALYRYYPSHDAILTALILRFYDDLGAEVEQAAAQAPAEPVCSAILAACHGFRWWARAHPHRYSLLFGTPVPGYDMPHEAMGQAGIRTQSALLEQLFRCVALGHVTLPEAPVPAGLRAPLAAFIAEKLHPSLTLPGAAAALQFWVLLLGSVTAELFCQLPLPIIEAGEDFFDFTIRGALVAIGADPAVVRAAHSPTRSPSPIRSPGPSQG